MVEPGRAAGLPRTRARLTMPGMYLTQPLRRALASMPDAVASADGPRQRSWRELADRVARLAGALHGLGLKPGGRVAILARNGDHYLDYIFGVLWAGGVMNPVNIRWAPIEIAYSLRDCDSDILLIDGHFLPILNQLWASAPGLRHVVFIGADPPPGIESLDALIAGAAPAEDALRGGDDLAAIFYTGGTTGKPKGVMLSHRNMFTSALSYAGARDCAPGSAMMHTAPLFHIGAVSGLMAAMLTGARHVFVPAFEPETVLAAIDKHRVTDIFFVPTMLQAVLDHPAVARHDLGSLERVVYGASPMPVALMDRAIAALPGIGFVQAYGMTELSPVATLLSPAEHGAAARASGRIRSAGRPTMVTEVRIVGPDGAEVPLGETGEIAVRGENVMQGYWNLPEATAAVIRDGWMHTGDAGRMDEAGYVYVVDRLKDMIITGGENVYSAEVENALSTHPGVSQCAVIGIPDPVWGEAVHAVIVPTGAAPAAAALIAHCRQTIAGYKCPRSFEFRDSLPLSGAGKVLKTELRKQTAGG